MLYDAMSYCRQVEAIDTAHRRRKDKSEPSEFLGGFYKGDRLRPVITLMIYWSDEEWDGKLSLHEIIDFPDEEFRSLVPDYRVNLLCPSMISNFAKLRTELSQVFQYIKCSGDDIMLTTLLEENDEFRHLDRASANLINAVTGSDLEFTEEGGKVDVCKAVNQMKEKARIEGEEQGFAEGEKQGYEKGEKQGFAEGEKQGFGKGDKCGEKRGVLNSIKNLMESTSWTAQAAMDALKIPEADRAGYLAKL